MNRFFIISVLFLTLSSGVVINTYKTTGGHPGSTGAPGEATCADATTGCHANASATNDSTNLVNQFQFSQADSTYTPGQTYTIVLGSQKSGIAKFGFEIIALKNSDNTNTGTWTITDGSRTHTLTGTGPQAGRKYVTHSQLGSKPFSSGLGQWTFKWNAPATNVGDIIFYYVTNCTNNDGTASGDQLFFSKFRIRPSAAAAVEEPVRTSGFYVQYHANSHDLHLNYTLKSAANTSVAVLDMQGKMLRQFPVSEKKAGKVLESFALPSDISPGTYLVQLRANEQVITKKFLVQ